jgi:hypothetical protein
MQAGWIRWARNGNEAGNVGEQVKIIIDEHFSTFIFEVDSVAVHWAADFEGVSAEGGGYKRFGHAQLTVGSQ